MRFYDRPEVRAAVAAIRRHEPEATGRALATAIRQLLRDELGHDADAGPTAPAGFRGDEARERAAALETVLSIVDEVIRAHPSAGVDAVRAELDRRAAHERTGSADGVNLLTYHPAKGLEWDAVFLPMLEDGTLPIRQAFDDAAALAEERRLLYVGITRARRRLHLSWADRREARGREGRRSRSRFLAGLAAPWARPGGGLAGAGRRTAAAPRTRPVPGDDPLFDALREWRSGQAREDGIAPFIVAHDSVLGAIAEARPTSLAALARVRGMGPTKVDRYGPAILAVVQAAGPPED